MIRLSYFCLTPYKIGYTISEDTMIRSFIEVPSFYKRWQEFGLSDKELRTLQIILLDNPDAGRIMQNTGGVRKLRFASQNRGKSAGFRICYVDFEEYGLTYLLTVFRKQDQGNLNAEEKRCIRSLVKELKKEAAARIERENHVKNV